MATREQGERVSRVPLPEVVSARFSHPFPTPCVRACVHACVVVRVLASSAADPSATTTESLLFRMEQGEEPLKPSLDRIKRISFGLKTIVQTDRSIDGSVDDSGARARVLCTA